MCKGEQRRHVTSELSDVIIWQHTNYQTSAVKHCLLHYNCKYLRYYSKTTAAFLESSRNVMAHGDAREGQWRENWRMEWVASTLHTTSEHGVSSITNADAHTSAVSSWLNWRPRRFNWTRPLRRKTNSGFCACAITLQTQPTSNTVWHNFPWHLPETCRLHISNLSCGKRTFQNVLRNHTKLTSKVNKKWHKTESLLCILVVLGF